MSWLVILVLVGQYTSAYSPQEPLSIESGTVLTDGSFRLAASYRGVNPDDFLSTPLMSSLAFSPDGFNQAGIYLPWLWVTPDSTSRVFLGNMSLDYKRRIIGSLDYGYLAAKFMARVSTARDTLGIKDSLGGRSSNFGLGLAYTYEFQLLREFSKVFGMLPLVATVAVEDTFLTRDNEAKQWSADFARPLVWGASLDIVPLDYVFAGASLEGSIEGISIVPHLGLRYYWIDLAAAYRMGSTNRLEFYLRLYL